MQEGASICRMLDTSSRADMNPVWLVWALINNRDSDSSACGMLSVWSMQWFWRRLWDCCMRSLADVMLNQRQKQMNITLSLLGPKASLILLRARVCGTVFYVERSWNHCIDQTESMPLKNLNLYYRSKSKLIKLLRGFMFPPLCCHRVRCDGWNGLLDDNERTHKICYQCTQQSRLGLINVLIISSYG